MPSRGTALDMGAAPGGWTRVLRGRGLRVIAVDPAEMDARLSRDSGIVYVRKRIQAYLLPNVKFEILANDMRMDAPESVGIMIQARDCLNPGGLAIVTLKLPEKAKDGYDTLKTVQTLVSRLAGSYKVLGARQLYHNRSEVTVALQAP
jgi:23S rRNA (cytidine2498-2'-O)-methyltransferase